MEGKDDVILPPMSSCSPTRLKRFPCRPEVRLRRVRGQLTYVPVTAIDPLE